MARPAFIYAFDNLGSERFAELCSLLLASRYKGFLRGGVGADGGVDGELGETFGVWHSESKDALLNEIIQPDQKVVFQFKHVVTGRAGGQIKARKHLLTMYKCRKGYVCEIHRKLVVQAKPDCYVLVTNVEVNSNFRAKFIQQCKSENPVIQRYQVVGLDELETWVNSEVELRHLYFPTIFGPPRLNLRIEVSEGVLLQRHGEDFGEKVPTLSVSVLNLGVAASYISSVAFKAIVDGEEKPVFYADLGEELLKGIIPKSGDVVEPGRRRDYHFPLDMLRDMIRTLGNQVFPFEVLVYDEVENLYRAGIPENLINKILG